MEEHMSRYIIGLDEGTTSARSVVFDTKTNSIVLTEKKTFPQYFPHPGWVEQNAQELVNAQLYTLKAVLKSINPHDVIGIGITNQRETVIAWDSATGKPIYNAIVWQCRRTAEYIDSLSKAKKALIKEKTGLIPDAYFSASKMKWILDNVPISRQLLKEGRLRFGNVNTYLAYVLTGEFVTDPTNASRTMLYNIRTLDWDDELLKLFGIDRSTLPRIVNCDAVIGKCKDFGDIMLCGMIGDQQSSLFGQSCVNAGMAKSTYGTGSFLLINTGNKLHHSDKLLNTVAFKIKGHMCYAIEGSIYSACNVIEWLKNNLGLIDSPSEMDKLCYSISDNEGVYLVPAFTGLGAPYWNSNAKCMLTGMTLGTTKAHVARSVLESIAYNTRSIIEVLPENVRVKELRVDGGGSKNTFLLQYQSDIIRKKVVKGLSSEATAMGAIYMVGLASGLYTLDDIKNMYKIEKVYEPKIKPSIAYKYYNEWQNNVKNSMRFDK